MKVNNGRTYYFPIYEWVEDGHVAFNGDTVCVEDVPVLEKYRTEYLKAQIQKYQWNDKGEEIATFIGINNKAKNHDDLDQDDQSEFKIVFHPSEFSFSTFTAKLENMEIVE